MYKLNVDNITASKLASYRNGNYIVNIYNDGTKERILDFGETSFISAFPESIDIKVTNRCNMNCPQCHEQSHLNGLHGNICATFIHTLHPYTEVALGGGNLLEHPNYMALLVNLKQKHIFSNITLHQQHVYENIETIQFLIKNDLIKGLGISFSGNLDQLDYILKTLCYDNIVVHVINGIITIKELQAMSRFKIVPKLLILGYKTFGRGIEFRKTHNDSITKNQSDLNNNILKILLNFPVVSFDNLALEQIDLSNVITPEEYERFYMGDDGQHTMYMDLVEEVFAKNSRSNVRYYLKDDIDTMFKVIREEEQYDKTNY